LKPQDFVLKKDDTFCTFSFNYPVSFFTFEQKLNCQHQTKFEMAPATTTEEFLSPVISSPASCPYEAATPPPLSPINSPYGLYPALDGS
jgi:hypothetical protein